MLEHRTLLESPFAVASAVRCPGLTSARCPEEQVSGAAVVLVRRGVFRRTADGRPALADVTTGYLQRPGESQRIDHPAGGDVCTAIAVADDLADRLAHAGPIRVTAAADLAHRRLLADPGEDRAADLIASLLPAPAPHPATDDVRALLHADPSCDLTTLAAVVGWSPWHLSRVFHRSTGSTLSAYRRRLRVRAALDALSAGAPLAAAANESGFADQAHMTRAIRSETGHTPGHLAVLLRAGDDDRTRAISGEGPPGSSGSIGLSRGRGL
jgi:AraC-like DNA-binding protein